MAWFCRLGADTRHTCFFHEPKRSGSLEPLETHTEFRYPGVKSSYLGSILLIKQYPTPLLLVRAGPSQHLGQHSSESLELYMMPICHIFNPQSQIEPSQLHPSQFNSDAPKPVPPAYGTSRIHVISNATEVVLTTTSSIYR